VKYEDFGSTTELQTQYLLEMSSHENFISIIYFSVEHVLRGQVCVSKLMFLHNKRSELADKKELWVAEFYLG